MDGSVPTAVPISAPTAVALDKEGDVFVAGSTIGGTGNQVFMVYSGGPVTPILAAVLAGASPTKGDIYLVGNTAGNFSLPSANTPFNQFPLNSVNTLAFDSADNLYIVDYLNYDVVKVNAGDAIANIVVGQFDQQYGNFGTPPAVDSILATQTQLNYPTDLKVDSFGNIYLVDESNGIVQVVYSGTQAPPVLAAEGRTVPASANNFIYQIAGQLGNPFCSSGCIDTGSATGSIGAFQTVAVDAAGNVYLQNSSDNFLDAIFVADVNGAVPPLLDAVTTSPQAGNIYPIAGYNAVACAATPCGDGGPAASAQFGFFGLYSMLVDGGGSLYFADYSVNAVRKIDAATGIVSTIAGIDDPNQTLPALPPTNGTPAIQAQVGNPQTIAFDAQQDYLYLNGFGPNSTSYNTLFQVGKVFSQTIDFPPLGTVVGGVNTVAYGAAPLSLSATASSGLPISYTLSAGAPATVSGSAAHGYALTITGAGTFTITASQAGNAQYSAAAPVTQTLQATPAPLTVTAGDLSPEYGTFNPANPGFTFTVTGFVNNDPPSLVTGAPNFTTNPTVTATSPQGTYQIIPTLGTLKANANYTFAKFVDGTLTVTGTVPQTIAFTLPSAPVTYGFAPIALNATASSGGPIKYILVSGPATISGSTLTIAGAGTIVVKATQGGYEQYAAATPVQQTLTVDPAPLTVTLPTLSLPYGTVVDPTTFPPPTITGFVGADSINSVTIAPIYTSPQPGKLDAGVYPITVNPANSGLTLAPAIAANYTFANFNNGQLTIVPTPQTIVAQPLSVNPINYGTFFTLTANATSGLPVTVAATGPLLAASAGNATAAYYATAVGTATITITQTGTKNIAAAPQWC